MSSGHQRIKWCRNIVENFNRLIRVHERYRQTDDCRQTDGRWHIANMNMSSRSLKSFETVPENSQRWSWGDVGRQTVPEAASSHRKCTIAISGQPCTSDHQLRMTTGDGGCWNRRRVVCSRRDTVAPDHAGIGKWAQPTWNWCVPIDALWVTSSFRVASLVLVLSP